MNKSLLTIVFVLGVIFFTSGVLAEVCTVVSRNDCSTSGGTVILGLSDSTNAHAQVWNATDYPGVDSNYTQVLCCDYSGSLDCTGTNVITTLSSISNAHAETSESTVYNVDVCYENLNCVNDSSGTPPAGYNITVLSLTSDTNAHVGNFSDYGTKIYCNFDSGIPPPPLSETFWAANLGASTPLNASTMGSTIYLKSINTGLSEGTTVVFEVFENDLAGNEEIRTIALGNEITGLVDVNGDVVANITITQADWDIGESLGEFSTGPEEEFYFTANGFTSEDIDITQLVNTILSCGEYLDQATCNLSYSQEVADNTVNQIGDKTCGETIPGENSCTSTVGCSCEWNTLLSTCEGSWITFPGTTCQPTDKLVEGTCNYVGSTQDTCIDGLLSYSVGAEWDWENLELNQAAYELLPVLEQADYVLGLDLNWHYDPTEISLSCSSSERTVPCPAQIQVPFFGMFQVLITSFIIIALYLISFIVRKDEN